MKKYMRIGSILLSIELHINMKAFITPAVGISFEKKYCEILVAMFFGAMTILVCRDV